jgi:hypothetical protein
MPIGSRDPPVLIVFSVLAAITSHTPALKNTPPLKTTPHAVGQITSGRCQSASAVVA